MAQIKRKCKFNSNLREKYPFLEETKIEGIIICKYCGAKISIVSGGNSDIVRHVKSKKHKDATLANQSIASYYRPKSDAVTAKGVLVFIITTIIVCRQFNS